MLVPFSETAGITGAINGALFISFGSLLIPIVPAFLIAASRSNWRQAGLAALLLAVPTAVLGG